MLECLGRSKRRRRREARLEMVTPDLGYSSSSFIPRPYKYNCGYFGNSADTKGQTCGRLRIQSIKERWKRPRRWEARLEMVTPDLNYSSPPPSSPSLCPESDCSNYLQLLQKIDFQRLGRFRPNMPLGVVYTGKKKKIYWHIKNELVPVTFVDLIFRSFAWNYEVMSLFLYISIYIFEKRERSE